MRKLELAVVLVLGLCLSGVEAAESRTVYVRAGRLVDGRSESVRTDVVIVVEGERIQRIGSASEIPIPTGADLIDLSRATVLPGLIDCHVHLGGRPDKYDEVDKFKLTPLSSALVAPKHARAALLAGFTSVRDTGSTPFLAVDLRNTIDEGYIIGPRIVASGPAIGMTGGHSDLNNYAPQIRMEPFPGARELYIADGPDAVRRAVRGQIRQGVDFIKVVATGGVLSMGNEPGAAHYTVEELRAIVETAHGLGRKVAAHAHGTQGIKNAILAGIDSIEHASLVDDEGIRLAREHGTYFVMDIYDDDYILSKGPELRLPKENLEKEKKVGQVQRDNFRKAHAGGVKMAFGTDAGVYPHGDNAKQFAYMVQYGMTPQQAIRAATVDAAELIGRAQDVGRIAEG
jgi:imidazolonepropionase-like amidohydrolase